MMKKSGNFIVKKTRVTDFSLTEALYPPKLQQSRHLHERASLSFVVSGSYTEKIERQSRVCNSLTLILHPAQEFHSVDFHNLPVRILNVEADFTFLSRFSVHSETLSSPISCRSEDIAWLGSRLFREFSQPDELSVLAIEGIILEMLVEAARQTSQKAEQKSVAWLTQATDFLHDNFSETVTLEEVAKVINIHPVHLARVFRRQFGCTMGEYVRLLRLEFAKRQLSATNKPLCEIALSAGFSDQSHLSKTFKNLFGLTPNQYRKTYHQS